MKCFDPVLCYTNEQGKKYYRHFSLASPIIKQMHQKVFACGKCLFCRKRKSYELSARCVLHASMYKQNCFITLTYDENRSGYHNDLDYSDIQKFKKRLRRHCEYHFKKKIEVFNVHEYGKNGKKHWHLIVFNHDFKDKKLFTVKNHIPIYTSKELEELWPYGFNTIGDVTTASAMYQAQYCEKDFRYGHQGTKKKSKSQHKGIGAPYFRANYKQILSLGYVPIDGKKMPVPRAFEKIADRHYCHYYDQSKFFDLKERKRRYTPFKQGEANKEIADLYAMYKKLKDEKIKELEIVWDAVILEHMVTKEDPEFKKSASNVLYDLSKKQNSNHF